MTVSESAVSKPSAKAAFLRSALKLFVRDGVDATSIRDQVAARLGRSILRDADRQVVQRQRTIAAIASNQTVQIIGFFAALFLSAIVVVALVRRIVGPVAAASHAADRITHGDLDTVIPISGRDELASLLGSMSTMRDSIRTMMDRERAQRRSAQARFVDAIENSLEGIAVIGPDGKIVVANAQAQLFFGKVGSHLRENGTFAELVLESIKRGVFPAETTGELRVLASGSNRAADIEQRLADGRWVRIVQNPTSEGGRIVTLSDISLLKEREFVLRDAKERAESANRAKTEFLTNMGHELRTPLNAVIGFSEIISGELMGPVGNHKYQEFAADITHSGRHLLAVINDILDLAKSEAGKIELEIKPVIIAAVFEDMRRFVQDEFTRAKVALEVVIPLPGVVVMADEVKLKQILLNLLSNAAKFTPAGGSTQLKADCDSQGRVVLSVRDSGIGMRPEDIPLALSPFGQIDSRLARKYEGTGLGLALTKALVELHGGELQIDSATGAGTIVSITLAGASVPAISAA